MRNKPYVIGIAGGSGSGKTFFLRCFLNHFSSAEASLVSQDDYYHPIGEMSDEENMHYNFDLPSTIDNAHFTDDIRKLIAGESILKKEYTFNNRHAKPKWLEIRSAPVIIVEGLFILHFKEIADLLDMKIFIDADDDVALRRRINRDFIERGYPEHSVRYKWINHVLPSYKEYLLPHKAICDLTVPNNTQVPDEIIAITDEISRNVREKVGLGKEA
ncbi:MAG: uridine kinase [Mucilaginibacter polytrichastri]|nr:uridine kinase [Mucilaginibacter polytrichastri]